MSEPTPMMAETGAQTESDRRGENRQPTCTRCELWVFDHDAKPSRVLDVVTRNTSFCGLSMVTRLPKPLRIGEPIEAMTESQEKGVTYVAGTVAFCRPVKDDYFELGLHVRAAGPNKILTDDLERGRVSYDWFTEALRLVEPD